MAKLFLTKRSKVCETALRVTTAIPLKSETMRKSKVRSKNSLVKARVKKLIVHLIKII